MSLDACESVKHEKCAHLVSGESIHLVMYFPGCAAKLVTGCNVVASEFVLE
jgi:hypothetical protein